MPSLNLLCHSKTDAQKTVWSIPYVSVAFFPSLKQNFMAYRSSKVFSCPDCIFEIHQLWKSGFSRMYSNCCCSCWFEAEIRKICQSSHKMYSNNILNFQESTTILNACTKKSGNLLNAPRRIQPVNVICGAVFTSWLCFNTEIFGVFSHLLVVLFTWLLLENFVLHRNSLRVTEQLEFRGSKIWTIRRVWQWFSIKHTCKFAAKIWWQNSVQAWSTLFDLLPFWIALIYFCYKPIPNIVGFPFKEKKIWKKKKFILI